MPRGYGVPGILESMKTVTPADGNANLNTQGNAIFGNKYSQFFWVGGSGDVNIMLEDGSTVLLKAAAAGEWHNCPPFRNVQNTNTDATDIVVASVY